MEKIIIYALIIAIGVLFEYIKKRARGDQSSKPVSQTPKPIAHVASKKPFAAAIPIVPPSPVKTLPKPVATVQAKPITNEQPKHFLPGEQVKEMTVKADDTAISDSNSGHLITPDTSEHFARWRKAIIDAEIIQRKF